MNVTNNSKLRYLTMFLNLFMIGFLAAPVTAQESPPMNPLPRKGPPPRTPRLLN